MPWSIDNDVLSAAPGEERSGRVDRDPLLLFFSERVEQKGVFKLLTLLTANGLDLFNFAFR